MTRIRKAVIAAAGFGTRFLPQTKAMPKEMLPLVDKPIIQHVVEELCDAGIQDIVIVTGYHKRSLEDHFDTVSADLTQNLLNSGKEELLKQVLGISELANFAYVRQKGPYGTGTPVIEAEHLIGDEAFVYLYADDFVLAEPSRIKQLIEAHKQYGGTLMTCVRATRPEDYKRYGYVAGQTQAPHIIKVDKIVEKPGSAQAAPSDFATVSGMILQPNIFRYLRQVRDRLKPEREFLLVDALQAMATDGHDVFGVEIQNGTFYDTGNKLEYLKTIVDFALMHDDVKDDFLAYIKDVAARGNR